jgi:uncharacterized protein (DUF362 family)
MSSEPLTRSDFLKLIGATTAGVAFLPGAEELLAGVAGETEEALAAARAYPYISVATGHSLVASHIAAITRAAINNLGGMGRFVHKGDDVVVKPNIYGTRTPNMACTTNPTVVATIVRECLKAGARRVRVMDRPCGGPAADSYRMSGIATAVKKAGGSAVIMSPSRFRYYKIPKGRRIQRLPLYPDIVNAHVLIDVPIAKVHGGGQITMACKNLMGCTSDPGAMHNRGLHQPIADLLSFLRPDLTVLDGIRVRVADGPGGTSLRDVRKRYVVVASTDPVAADAYGAKYLLGKNPNSIAHLYNAKLMGLGRTDIAKLSIRKVKL